MSRFTVWDEPDGIYVARWTAGQREYAIRTGNAVIRWVPCDVHGAALEPLVTPDDPVPAETLWEAYGWH